MASLQEQCIDIKEYTLLKDYYQFEMDRLAVEFLFRFPIEGMGENPNQYSILQRNGCSRLWVDAPKKQSFARMARKINSLGKMEIMKLP